jgi:putative heme iron utilization protein
MIVAQANKAMHDTPSKADLAGNARALVRTGLKAALASRDAKTGVPYASLITVATDAAGAPLFLISTLARHTQNVLADPRCSILFDGTGTTGDPLQGGRATLLGRAERTEDEAARRRFLARHPEAAFYAGFPDFAVWRLAVSGGHYIGGFGRIVDLAPDELLVATAGCEDLLGAEPGIVAHMNEDHQDAIRLYATYLAGGPEGVWRMSGIDPEGIDLLFEGDARRVVFAAPISTPAEARSELVRLAQEARLPR